MVFENDIHAHNKSQNSQINSLIFSNNDSYFSNVAGAMATPNGASIIHDSSTRTSVLKSKLEKTVTLSSQDFL